MSKAPNGKGISCCSEIYTDFPEFLHPECFAIRIPPDDPYYSQYGEYCMNFVRSAATARPNCYMGPREQINQLTSWIDGSMIYGSTAARQRMLRTYQGGLLITYTMHDRQYLPLNEDNRDAALGADCAIPPESDRKCFLAGDIRSNEVVHMTVLQTVFLREHNRIASILSRLNGHWDDETIFQETRRVVAALLQQIMYREVLPYYIGNELMVRYNLVLKSNGYFRGYDPNMDGRIGTGFATAAYRFHSLIAGMCRMYGHHNSVYFNLSK